MGGLKLAWKRQKGISTGIDSVLCKFYSPNTSPSPSIKNSLWILERGVEKFAVEEKCEDVVELDS